MPSCLCVKLIYPRLKKSPANAALIISSLFIDLFGLALVGAAIMLAGENTRLVAEAVKEKLAIVQEKLPPGVVIRPLYDRSELVNRTIRTVETNLAEGALLVVVVLFALLVFSLTKRYGAD